jgi:pyruvate dehydrogenase (quinone)
MRWRKELAPSCFPGPPGDLAIGDGSFTMLMGDFLTLAQHRLPVKVVVFNNGALGLSSSIRSSPDFSFPHGAQEPKFRVDGRSRGHTRHPARRPGEVDEGIAAALAHDGPVRIDAVVYRTDLAMPPLLPWRWRRVSRFTRLKAVISRRGDEVVDLAKTNLWR